MNQHVSWKNVCKMLHDGKYTDRLSRYKTRNGDGYKTCILQAHQSVIALTNLGVGAMNSNTKGKGHQ